MTYPKKDRPESAPDLWSQRVPGQGWSPWWRRDLRPPGAPPITQTAFSACRAQYPGGLDQVHMLVTSLPTRPSPSHRRVGVHDYTFEACSSFTRVTACKVARPPCVGFVTRLRGSRFPSCHAR
jgi:hypothetical protein